MADSTLWWVLTGAAVALEMITGTFYLLMLATGLAAAALAAHAGAGMTAQMVVVAVVGVGAVVGWHFKRQKSAGTSPTGTNRDVNLDVGETVHVDSWTADGKTSVKYRGAQWSAVAVSGNANRIGLHRIVQIKGSELVLEKLDS